jgi:hypothetical protein
MTNKILIIIFLIALAVPACKTFQAPETSDVEIDDQLFILEKKAKSLKVDKLGFIYILTNRNTINKYDKSGKILFEYNNTLYGEIHDLDVSNPMKIIVFFQDFQVIELVDNTLVPLRTYTLLDYDFAEVRCVSMSNDNQFWIYDAGKLKLFKMDINGNILMESNNLVAESGLSIDIQQIKEESNYIVLRDPSKLILLDNYTQWIKYFDHQNEKLIRVSPNFIYFLNNNTLNTIPIKDVMAETQQIRIFQEEVLDIGFSEKILILTKNGVKLLEQD